MKSLFRWVVALGIVLLSVSSTFAYTPNNSDTVLMEKVGEKVSMIAERNPQGLTRIADRIEGMLTNLPEQSRASYILSMVHEKIMEVLWETDVEELLEDLLWEERMRWNRDENMKKEKKSNEDEDEDEDTLS